MARELPALQPRSSSRAPAELQQSEASDTACSAGLTAMRGLCGVCGLSGDAGSGESQSSLGPERVWTPPA